MKYFTALSLAAGLAAATMEVMSVAPAAAGKVTHTVIVGGLKPVATGMAPVLGFSPESITAEIGDEVKFVFMQKNHTATQSTFANPCKKMEGGMDSGFMPNPEGKAGVEFTVPVTSKDAMWFYCKQKNGVHCGKGMVMAINAATTGDKTFEAYKQLAVQQNGTETLTTAPLNQAAATAAAAPSTVTVLAGEGGGTATGAGAAATASIAAGQGVTGNGEACSCSCLCGVNSFPQNVANGQFGGFVGQF